MRMVHVATLAFLATTLVLVPARATAGGPAPARPAVLPATGFSPGERIDLDLDYIGIRAGRARIMVGRPEGSIWPVVCQGRTEGLARMFDIREHLVSYWDSAAGLPRGTDLSAIEVGDRHVDISRFDREHGMATVLVERKGQKSQKTVPIPPGVHDIASALMALRSRPLAPGDHVELPVFTGSETSTLVADVLGRERVDAPAGKFDTVRVQVRTAFQGKFKSRRDSVVWFSDDPRHVPVRLKTDLALGSIVANLTGYKAGGEVARR